MFLRKRELRLPAMVTEDEEMREKKRKEMVIKRNCKKSPRDDKTEQRLNSLEKSVEELFTAVKELRKLHDVLSKKTPRHFTNLESPGPSGVNRPIVQREVESPAIRNLKKEYSSR